MKSKLLLLTSAFCFFTSAMFSQGVWKQKANFGGTARFVASGFSIGTKGYIGIGADAGFANFFVDFWEWDQSTNVWTQKAVYPGCSGATAVSFSIGTRGYIATGQNTCGNGFTGQLWEYNSITNNWTQRAALPGTPTRAWSVGFSIGTKGYIGTGAKDFGSPITAYDDFWEWDQLSDTWTQKTSYPGGPRKYAAGFSIGTKGYIGTGMDNSVNPAIDIVTKDFWEWDQSTDSWSQKADFPGVARGYACAFSIGTKGYMGMGHDTAWNGFPDFYEYEPSTNSWSQKANGYLGLAAAFAIGTKGYLGTGYSASGISNELWQFTPNCNIVLNINTTNSGCGLANGTATVVATNGTAPYTYQWTNGDKTATADSLSAGLYMVLVTDASGCTDTKPVMINDNSAPVITVNTVTDVTCNGGSNGAITINVNGGNPPYTYFWANGNTNQNMSNLQAGPHQVQVTDANGCVAMKLILVSEPSPISHSISKTNASCGNADGTATDSAYGGTAPYLYAWSTTPVQNTNTATGLSAGGYFVLVTDNNGCTDIGAANIVSFGAPSAVIDSFIPATCGGGLGSVYISAIGGAGPPYSYVWSTGATTQNLIGVPAGNYGVSIKASTNPCLGAFSGTLPSKEPYTPSICIVSVDTLTGKNQCLFTKDSILNLGLKQYNFYRETTTAGVYQKLGSKAANLPSIWTDQSANPLQRAWRYKITAEDSCGNEAVISNMHKTIHMVSNLGLNNTVNLSWDDYEGFAYGTFIIYRYTTATGWDSLDALPSNLHSYTDFNPPVPIVDVYYYIEVMSPSPCTSSIANPGDDEKKNPELMATNLNSSRSNIYKINPTPTGVNEASMLNGIVVYPNPSKGEFTVSGLQSAVELSVYNLVGEKVYCKTVNSKKETVTLDEANGIYFLKINTEKGAVTKKIILQK